MNKLFIIAIVLAGCTQEVIVPAEEERVCVFRTRLASTDASCIIRGDCPPRYSFVKCIEKWEAYRYSGKDNQVIQEDCDQCK